MYYLSSLSAVVLTAAVVAVWWFTRRMRLNRRRSAWCAVAVALGAGVWIWATFRFLLPRDGPLDILIELVLGISLCMGAGFTSLGVAIGFLVEGVFGKKVPFWAVPISLGA